jgi:hypothetical protein
MNTNLNNSDRIWEAEINHQVFQTSLDELKSWVTSGKLKPSHKVRMKNLNWIEVHKILAFSKLFEAKDKNKPQNFTQSALTAPTVNPSPFRTNDSVTSNLITGTAVPPPVAPPIFEKNGGDFPLLKEIHSSETLTPQKMEQMEEAKSNGRSVEFFSVPPDISFEKKQPEKSPFIRIKSKVKVRQTENMVLCPSCFYFCRFIPKSVDASPFSCPVCFSNCDFIIPNDSTSNTGKSTVLKANNGEVLFPFASGDPTIMLPKKQKTALSFLFGCILIALIAVGGAYLWVFQFRPPTEKDEKTNQELIVLQEKFTTDKIGVTTKFAALEQLQQTAENRGNAASETDISQELAKLQRQYDLDRKNINENYQIKKANNDFEMLSIISFVSLLVLFVLKRLLLS